MQLVLDQMLDIDVLHALQDWGHDVVRVSDLGMARANDQDVLKWAITNNRILVTLDSDYGDWAVLPLAKHPGVIRIKAKPAHTENILDTLRSFLPVHGKNDFANKLVIVSRANVRWIQTGHPSS